jgi:hypothetical protein
MGAPVHTLDEPTRTWCCQVSCHWPNFMHLLCQKPRYVCRGMCSWLYVFLCGVCCAPAASLWSTGHISSRSGQTCTSTTLSSEFRQPQFLHFLCSKPRGAGHLLPASCGCCVCCLSADLWLARGEEGQVTSYKSYASIRAWLSLCCSVRK